MRRLLRSEGVVRASSALLAAYLKFCYATMRWTIEGEDVIARAQSDLSVRTIVCFWHSRISLCARAWRNASSPKQINALVSNSKDGDFIADILMRMGFPSVRGSRTRENSLGEKGGSAAFREILRDLKDGRAQGITPDGPAGPARVMGEGAPAIARLSGGEVLFLGMACKPCLRARSWDETVIPLPFARGAIVWRGPATAARDSDPALLAKDWTDRLNAATDEAEALVA